MATQRCEEGSSGSSHQREPCHSCLEVQNDRDVGLGCDQGHFLCPSCMRHFFDMVLKDPTNWSAMVPLKCQMCSTPYYPNKLEALFTPEEAKLYAEASAVVSVGPGEVLLSCAFCSGAVICDKFDPPLLYFCRSPTCHKTWCTVCRREVQLPLNGDQWWVTQPHLIGCGSLAVAKNAVEHALHLGLHRACPYCRLEGMKDDACTHMTCARCGNLWCYFCGKKVEECPKPAGAPANNINCHNDEWQTHSDRCPRYLEGFHDIDPAWPSTGLEALGQYHRARSLRFLRAEVARLGRPAVAELLQAFPAVLGGFTLEQVESFQDTPWMRQRLAHCV